MNGSVATNAPGATSSAEVRDSVLGWLRAHDLADGQGPDSLDAGLRVHPMAEGKLLSTLGCLVAADAIARPSALRMASRAIDRLARLEQPGGGFGLGFQWGDDPPDTAYTITTALVARGLVDAGELLPPEGTALLERTTDWLRRLPDAGVELDGRRLVPYAPTRPLVAWNVVASWAGAIRAVGEPDPGSPMLEAVHAARRGGLWPYGPDRESRDLVHNAYIVRALWEAERLSPVEALTTIGAFLWPPDGRTADVIEPVSDARRFAALALKGELLPGDPPLRRGPGGPRPWSIGEGLLVVADIARHQAAARPLVRPLARLAIETLAASDWPRHRAHLAHGLASALWTLVVARRSAVAQA